MEQIPRPGEFYRHFKDKLYQVIAIAEHTETGEQMVVYQALYGTYGIYVRPLSMFMSPVDREKYPDAKQTDRFERVLFQAQPETETGTVDGTAGQNAAGQAGQGAVGQAGQNAASQAGQSAASQAAADRGPVCHTMAVTVPEENTHKELSPLVRPFVESDTYEQKLEILTAMRGKVGQEELDVLYVALDLPQRTGDVNGQIDAIEKYLLMQLKFDGNRLR